MPAGKEAVHMFPIAVGENHHSNRLGRDFGDVFQQLFSSGRRGRGIHHDHSLISDNREDSAGSAGEIEADIRG